MARQWNTELNGFSFSCFGIFSIDLYVDLGVSIVGLSSETFSSFPLLTSTSSLPRYSRKFVHLTGT